jgi:hypothetical protein
MARARKLGLIGHILLTFFSGGLWLIFLVIRHVTK